MDSTNIAQNSTEIVISEPLYTDPERLIAGLVITIRTGIRNKGSRSEDHDESPGLASKDYDQYQKSVQEDQDQKNRTRRPGPEVQEQRTRIKIWTRTGARDEAKKFAFLTFVTHGLSLWLFTKTIEFRNIFGYLCSANAIASVIFAIFSGTSCAFITFS
uniref:Uncharacterized protein n=1 Tax=Acrobeloides nanus TaxID=290746 RepID=A0A914CXV9_9BILA